MKKKYKGNMEMIGVLFPSFDDEFNFTVFIIIWVNSHQKLRISSMSLVLI